MPDDSTNNKILFTSICSDRRFHLFLAVALLAGIVIRCTYFVHFPSNIASYISGDGLNYHQVAHRLADGLGYTSSPLWEEGAEFAHSPPAWVTLLGGISSLGFRSMGAHQVTGIILGLAGVIAITLLARQLLGNQTAAITAFFAALYPGFWVMEPQLLSEPLTILTAALVIMSIYKLIKSPGLFVAIGTGLLLGLLALCRSEQFLILFFATGVGLLLMKGVSLHVRFVYGMVISLCIILLIAPWAIHNSKRFKEPVLTGTNMGVTLLVGNCPSTFQGEYQGFWDFRCFVRHDKQLQAAADASVRNKVARRIAQGYILRNLDKMPATVLARYGRALGIYKTRHTVDAVAEWNGTETWPVILWITGFLCILPLSVIGLVGAFRERVTLYPLLAPIAVSMAVVAVFYGEPRYHLVADLSFLILAGHGAALLYNKFASNTGKL